MLGNSGKYPYLRPLKTLFLGAFLLVSTGAFAQETQSLPPAPLSDKNNISSADSVAKALIEALPNSYTKDGLKRYYEILNPEAYSSDTDVAMSNTGLALYFQHHFAQNKCFAEKALRFYNELRRTTKSHQKEANDTTRHDRPSLGDKAGENRPDLKPGWLYEKALQYTKGNANAALTLIGMCGHDDKRQGLFINNEVAQKLYAQGFKESDFYSTEEDPTPSICPLKTADFYIAGSLSKNADISDSLKKRILAIQYPGKKAEQIAAKNYHVLGAAFMTCQMIEAGMNSFLAVKVEGLAANLYRGIRLCQDIETPANLYRRLQWNADVQRYRYRGQDFSQAVLNAALEKGRSKACLHSGSAGVGTQKPKEDAVCDLLKTVGAPFDLSIPRLEKRAEGLVQGYMEHMIASGLYASWHVSGEIAGISLPCSREQLFGPGAFMKWLVAQGQLPVNICGGGLSVESCRKALGTLASWEADFDWTVAQHTAGAKFAASVCKYYPNNKKSIDEFCD